MRQQFARLDAFVPANQPTHAGRQAEAGRTAPPTPPPRAGTAAAAHAPSRHSTACAAGSLHIVAVRGPDVDVVQALELAMVHQGRLNAGGPRALQGGGMQGSGGLLAGLLLWPAADRRVQGRMRVHAHSRWPSLAMRRQLPAMAHQGTSGTCDCAQQAGCAAAPARSLALGSRPCSSR